MGDILSRDWTKVIDGAVEPPFSELLVALCLPGFRGELRLLVRLMHVHPQYLAGNHWRSFGNLALFTGTLLLLPAWAVASLAVASAIPPGK